MARAGSGNGGIKSSILRRQPRNILIPLRVSCTANLLTPESDSVATMLSGQVFH